MKSTLLFTQLINTNGVADETEKISITTQAFTKPTNILVQALLSSSFFNRQDKSFWKVELTIDSYETVENKKKVLHTVPVSSLLNAFEISNCNWVKVRLTARNGGGSGIVNIYG